MYFDVAADPTHNGGQGFDQMIQSHFFCLSSYLSFSARDTNTLVSATSLAATDHPLASGVGEVASAIWAQGHEARSRKRRIYAVTSPFSQWIVERLSLGHSGHRCQFDISYLFSS